MKCRYVVIVHAQNIPAYKKTEERGVQSCLSTNSSNIQWEKTEIWVLCSKNYLYYLYICNTSIFSLNLAKDIYLHTKTLTYLKKSSFLNKSLS